MSIYNILPFPRGETACGGEVTATDTIYEAWQGMVVSTYDKVFDKPKVELIALRNDSGADITSGYMFYRPSTTLADGDFVQSVAGVANELGRFAYMIDPAYGLTLAAGAFPNNDIGWFVKWGFAYGITEASAVNLCPGDAIVSDASGYVDGAAPAAGSAALGRYVESAYTRMTGSMVMIFIDSSIVGGEGA